MTDAHFSPIRLKGWARMGLPAAIFLLFATPMLWALGLFDATAEPLRNAVVFAVSGIALCGLTPTLVGWAVQGFVVRRRTSDENDEPAAGHHAAPQLNSTVSVGRVKAS